MRKGRIFELLLILALFAAGAGLMAYPAASNLLNQLWQEQTARDYQEAVGSWPQEELDRLWAQARRYNEDLLKDEIIVDPFHQVKERKAGIEYYQALNPQDNGVMGTVRIPSIGVELPVCHGTEEETLQKAVGHLEQTSLPVGGPGTHAVISGHRGLPSAKLFTDLDRMELGDVFYMDVLDKTLAYQVDRITIVEPNQLEELAIISGEDHVTLVTCTPYAVNSHRLLVRGTRTTDQEAAAWLETEEEKEGRFAAWPYLPAAALAVCTFFLIRRRKGRRN